MPPGIKLIRVDAKTGMRAGPGDGGNTILEAFKPGTAPPDNYSVIGVGDADGSWRLPAADSGGPAASCARVPAGCIVAGHRRTDSALEIARGRLRFRPHAATSQSQFRVAAISPMRAEVERLVEEIKQSVGLLRRHL